MSQAQESLANSALEEEEARQEEITQRLAMLLDNGRIWATTRVASLPTVVGKAFGDSRYWLGRFVLFLSPLHEFYR